ncbi:hypothetical protein CMUS01_05842 [Colletotrichum musicola]|uniref:Uncharacterized protein n=1 Tax=Colletotrichum musicola TaxID=2175873 RepID=A0A8H6KQT8_9PEZI|nr:hypothetical protein CMUS01_05842 [Colletotrichum musicola]
MRPPQSTSIPRTAGSQMGSLDDAARRGPGRRLPLNSPASLILHPSRRPASPIPHQEDDPSLPSPTGPARPLPSRLPDEQPTTFNPRTYTMPLEYGALTETTIGDPKS